MAAPYQLTPDQIEVLAQMVRDESGDNLIRPDFTDHMLKLFEVIAGFETLRATLRRS